MEHRLSCCSSTRPRRSAQRQGTLPNDALHLTTARAQKECAVAGEREGYAASFHSRGSNIYFHRFDEGRFCDDCFSTSRVDFIGDLDGNVPAEFSSTAF